MSKGSGRIENWVADLFAATRDRALTVSEISDYAFEIGGGTPTWAQRLSATRAAHRLLKRIRETAKRREDLYAQAVREAEAASGEAVGDRYAAAIVTTKAWRQAKKLHAFVGRFSSRLHFERIDRDNYRAHRDYWRSTADKSGTLYFHPPDVPVRVWAVSI